MAEDVTDVVAMVLDERLVRLVLMTFTVELEVCGFKVLLAPEERPQSLLCLRGKCTPEARSVVASNEKRERGRMFEQL